MPNSNPWPWEPCGWLRMIFAAVLMIILDVISKLLVLARLLRAASLVNRAIMRIAVWSGITSDGGC